MNTPSRRTSPASPNDDTRLDGDVRPDDHRPHDLEDREAAAVDAATAERLSDGVRRDVHGELTPDPYPDADDPGDSTDDVIEHHRQQADRLEHQPDVPRAGD